MTTIADAPRRAWLLNMDAELELRRPARYQPTKNSLRACEHFEPLARGLVAASDLVVSRDVPVPGIAKGYLGVAWCPTPSALAALRHAGATLEPVPDLTCLQRVNHRRFHAELGQLLDGALFASDVETARRVLASPSPAGWMVKRGFGFAGRSNRRFPPAPTADDWRWLDHAFLDGGVQIEPWVVVLAEYSLHALIAPNGTTTIGLPCVRLSTERPSYARESDAHGSAAFDTAAFDTAAFDTAAFDTAAFDTAALGATQNTASPNAAQGTAQDTALAPSERAALYEQVRAVSLALHAVGYFGPFGIDAFRYESSEGPRFNPRSEINARYTLAFATGMDRTAR